MTAKELIEQSCFDNVLLLENFSYDDALIGVTSQNRAVYDFNKMVEWLITTEGFTYEQAVEWIEYNTIKSLPYFGEQAPIIMYSLEDYRC